MTSLHTILLPANRRPLLVWIIAAIYLINGFFPLFGMFCALLQGWPTPLAYSRRLGISEYGLNLFHLAELLIMAIAGIQLLKLRKNAVTACGAVFMLESVFFLIRFMQGEFVRASLDLAHSAMPTTSGELILIALLSVAFTFGAWRYARKLRKDGILS